MTESLPRDDNPLVWRVALKGGFEVDIRDMPRESQEAAYEMGLIPYIPADRRGITLPSRPADDRRG